MKSKLSQRKRMGHSMEFIFDPRVWELYQMGYRPAIKILVAMGIAIALYACDVEPKKINYGSDHCHYCDMTVVDKAHSAEYVTKKGKGYVFDATECLVMKLQEEKNENKMAFVLVADFASPGTLIDAKTASYLICDKIKSPMGANLSAFNSKEAAQKVQKENGGELFTWEEIKSKLAN